MYKIMHAQLKFIAFTLIAISTVASSFASAQAPHVNVYSYRQPFLVAPLFARFTEITGIDVKMVFAKKGLIERAHAEGKHSPADIILTTDIGNLIHAAQLVAQPVQSSVLQAAIPAQARDPENLWFGLSFRARIGFASKARIAQTQLTYSDLAHHDWKGKICMRNGQHPYNIGLIAAHIAHYGEAKTRSWLHGIKQNLAVKPSGNDRGQVQKVYAGICDIAIGNTYYMGKMQTNEKNPEQKQWAEAVNIIFPQFDNGKTHVNLSGMVMTKHAPNAQNALKLMEFLVSPAAQQIYAETNFEYPVREGVALSKRVTQWGIFDMDDTPMHRIAALRAQASKLVDAVGFNQGP